MEVILLNEDDEFIVTAEEAVKGFKADVNAALDVITSDDTIDEEARAALIRKFEEIDELLDEARAILPKESSESE
jgi:hypothetical protein